MAPRPAPRGPAAPTLPRALGVWSLGRPPDFQVLIISASSLGPHTGAGRFLQLPPVFPMNRGDSIFPDIWRTLLANVVGAALTCVRRELLSTWDLFISEPSGPSSEGVLLHVGSEAQASLCLLLQVRDPVAIAACPKQPSRPRTGDCGEH
ncbi:hypothetical protein H8959_019999 [Pygathrix nigripes]